MFFFVNISEYIGTYLSRSKTACSLSKGENLASKIMLDGSLTLMMVSL
jgi:hypothetical protein